MAKAKAIIWKGPDRLIPPHGSVQPGDRRDNLPKEVAESFVKQNLAEWEESTKRGKEKGE